MTHGGDEPPMPINPMAEDPFAHSSSSMRRSNDFRPVPRPAEYSIEEHHRYDTRLPVPYPNRPEYRDDPYASSGPASKYPRYDSRGQPDDRDFRAPDYRPEPSSFRRLPPPAPALQERNFTSSDSRRDANPRFDSGRNEPQQQQGQRSLEEYHARLEELVTRRGSMQRSTNNEENRRKSPPRPPSISHENSRQNVMNDYFYKRNANPVANTAPRSDEWANKVDEYMGHIDKPRRKPQGGTPYDPEIETDIEVIEMRGGPATPPPLPPPTRSKPKNVLDAINSVPSQSRWAAPDVERDKFGFLKASNSERARRYSPERDDRQRLDDEIRRLEEENGRFASSSSQRNANESRSRVENNQQFFDRSRLRNEILYDSKYDRREPASRSREIYHDRRHEYYRGSNRSPDRRERRLNDFYDERRRVEDSQEERAADMVREVICHL